MTNEVTPALQATSLSRIFGATVALDDVSVSIAPGESVALLGENGAGKSTLAKVLTGAIAPDRGGLRVAGSAKSFGSPRDALAAGIAYIPQELAYIAQLTVGENLLLNRWPGRAGLTSRSAIRRASRALLEEFDVRLDVDEPLSNLKLADRQLVEIVKVLSRRASVVVLDEPTAALSERESETLFAVLRRLTATGVSIISVLHRIDHVQGIADRVLVMRNGRVVLDAPRDAPRRDLVRAMLGEAADPETATHRPQQTGPAALTLESIATGGNPGLSDLSLTMSRGEVVSVFGARGSGIEDIGGVLSGRLRPSSGSIRTGKGSFRRIRGPRAARALGIAHVPPERKSQGLVLGLSVASNTSLMSMSPVSRLGILRRHAERTRANELCALLDVRYRSASQPVGELSGGNQQKVLLASRLASAPQILVLEQPTRGVDIGARAQIHAKLRDLAADGTTVVAITSDVEEAVSMADRVLVVYEGRIVDELIGDRRTQEAALRAGSGDA